MPLCKGIIRLMPCAIEKCVQNRYVVQYAVAPTYPFIFKSLVAIWRVFEVFKVSSWSIQSIQVKHLENIGVLILMDLEYMLTSL